jgi:hypothetical protein
LDRHGSAYAMKFIPHHMTRDIEKQLNAKKLISPYIAAVKDVVRTFDSTSFSLNDYHTIQSLYVMM